MCPTTMQKPNASASLEVVLRGVFAHRNLFLARGAKSQEFMVMNLLKCDDFSLDALKRFFLAEARPTGHGVGATVRDLIMQWEQRFDPNLAFLSPSQRVVGLLGDLGGATTESLPAALYDAVDNVVDLFFVMQRFANANGILLGTLFWTLATSLITTPASSDASLLLLLRRGITGMAVLLGCRGYTLNVQLNEVIDHSVRLIGQARPNGTSMEPAVVRSVVKLPFSLVCFHDVFLDNVVFVGELERDFIYPVICVTENRDTQIKPSLWMQDVTVRACVIWLELCPASIDQRARSRCGTVRSTRTTSPTWCCAR